MSLRIVDSQFALAIRPREAETRAAETRAAETRAADKRPSGKQANEAEASGKGRELRGPQRLLRAEQRQTQQSAQLEIKTQDGDTVTLSFASRSLEQSQSLRTPNGYVQSQQSSSSFEFNLSIEGNLSDAEVADIKKVIESLNNPAPPSNDLGSLESYSYAYQRASTFSASTLSYSA
jgi:hypothetical protein